MPPANRHEPRRAKSSTSDYSVTEFLRESPDDAACLEHLWRSRYSPDGEHAECPKCERERVFKRYATAQGRQSWTCTGCGHHDEYAWRYNERFRGHRSMFHMLLEKAAK